MINNSEELLDLFACYTTVSFKLIDGWSGAGRFYHLSPRKYPNFLGQRKYSFKIVQEAISNEWIKEIEGPYNGTWCYTLTFKGLWEWYKMERIRNYDK